MKAPRQLTTGEQGLVAKVREREEALRLDEVLFPSSIESESGGGGAESVRNGLAEITQHNARWALSVWKKRRM